MTAKEKEELTVAIEDYLNSVPYEPFHCSHCGRWLSNEKVMIGVFETKCKNCKEMNTFYRVDLEVLIEAIENFSSKK